MCEWNVNFFTKATYLEFGILVINYHNIDTLFSVAVRGKIEWKDCKPYLFIYFQLGKVNTSLSSLYFPLSLFVSGQLKYSKQARLLRHLRGFVQCKHGSDHRLI